MSKEKRMFSNDIVNSRAFTKLSSQCQALYFQLSMDCDDDGINDNIDIAIVKSHASLNDLQTLIDNKFILSFNNNDIIVVKHWKINNYIRGDRYKKSNYDNILNQLEVKENGSYTLKSGDGCQPSGNQEDTTSHTEIKLDKIRLDKNSIDNNIVEQNDTKSKRFVKPTLKDIQDYCEEKGYLGFDAQRFIDYYDSVDWHVGKNHMKDWKASVRLWVSKNKNNKQTYNNKSSRNRLVPSNDEEGEII